MKTPKDCKNIEELMEFEMNLRSKLILSVAKIQGQITLQQRSLELFASNPTEEMWAEVSGQMEAPYWEQLRTEAKLFLTTIKEVARMRNELAPKMLVPYPFLSGMGGFPGGMNPA